MPEKASGVVAYLRSSQAIRERTGKLLAMARNDALTGFRLHEDRLGHVADEVVTVIRAAYPDLVIPVHSRFRHFDVGGVPRLAEVDARLAGLSADDRARAKLDLAIVSVLLDAGAGAAWRYREAESGREFSRSEGLAVASLRMFLAGAFSSDPKQPLRADAEGLARIDGDAIRLGFQVNTANPLEGVEGRAALLRALGAAMDEDGELFGDELPRPGHLLDALRARADGGRVRAHQILDAVLAGLSPIWPGRITLNGHNLGDVWEYPPLGGATLADRLVPFHKLSQWLSYSLFEPLEEAGLSIVERNAMTGLAEYRNGGLFVDGGVLEVRDPAALTIAHQPSSPLVIEWRALTVALLDALHPLVCERIGKTQESFPLANMLEGGTWATGRKLAQKRPGGTPPLSIVSDGTVFLTPRAAGRVLAARPGISFRPPDALGGPEELDPIPKGLR